MPAAPSAEAAAIDAVLLDAGGVLVLPHHEILAMHALDRLGIAPEPDELDRAHYVGGHTLAVWPDDEETIFATWNRAYLEHLGAEASPANLQLLKQAFQRLDMWTQPAPGVHEGLTAIARTGVRLAVVSNADGQAEEMLRDIGVCQVGDGPGVRVHAVIDSTVVGVAKPDPRIFRIALDRIGVAPERAVHVGDIIGADVNGARAAGVRPLHFDPVGICSAGDHGHVASLAAVADLVAESRSRS